MKWIETRNQKKNLIDNYILFILLACRYDRRITANVSYLAVCSFIYHNYLTLPLYFLSNNCTCLIRYIYRSETKINRNPKQIHDINFFYIKILLLNKSKIKTKLFTVMVITELNINKYP